ncbi:phosphate/phosphite/phosphonate ABC transporter substrate-binding protein [Curvivirga sp.]|uniref:phosphate/phosphite/phosphonate ABC transporter substrate-binding protein n=1 Tax=Curvivirga sp. TaxID=2856848 RepID=UPI003B5CC06F
MASLAILPMYDWPEVRPYTDRYYMNLKEAISRAGFTVPDGLLHDQDDLKAIWRSSDLIIGQTCGLPFMRFLQGDVAHLGSPIYNNDCTAGFYNSVIIARDTYELDELYKMKFGCNGFDSQSGYACLQNHFVKHGYSYLDPKEITITGSHRNSVNAVYSGEIDYAVIDNVSWKLALNHEPAASKVKIVGHTQERASLPYISSLKNKKRLDALVGAIQLGIQTLDQDIKDNLFIEGFLANTENHYQIIKNDYQDIIEALNIEKSDGEK